MIGHNTTMRDWLATVVRVRSNDLARTSPKAKPRSKEVKRRFDDLEQRRDYLALAGNDPY